MGKSIDSLVSDIYNVLDEQNDHTVSDENLDWAAGAFREILATRFKSRKPGNAIRFSSLGKKDRQIWYDAHPPEDTEVMPPNALFKFLYGDCIEVLLLFLAREAGHEVTDEQFEVEVDGIFGHMDATIDGVPVDCKSASPYSFQKFKDGSFVFEDPFGYIPQLSGYANARGNTDRAGFLVADKVAGSIAFAEIDKATIEGNPPAPRIAELKSIIASETPPPRCYDAVPEGKSGNMKLGLGCSYCSRKNPCWADANGGQGLRKFWYSRGPVWLVDVKKEPNVEEAK